MTQKQRNRRYYLHKKLRQNSIKYDAKKKILYSISDAELSKYDKELFTNFGYLRQMTIA